MDGRGRGREEGEEEREWRGVDGGTSIQTLYILICIIAGFLA